jgi:hypothetical protein
MPNHCENDLYLSGNPEQIAALLDFIGANETPPQFDFSRILPYPKRLADMDREMQEMANAGHQAGLQAALAILDCAWEDRRFDPRRHDAEEAYVAASAAARNPLQAAYLEKWGTYTDGYNSGGFLWCITNWGTKWGAYNVERRGYNGRVMITFQTAWCPPNDVIFSELHKRFPLVTLDLEYYERGCGFCGGASWNCEEDHYDDTPWQAGVKVEEWHNTEYRGKRGG